MADPERQRFWCSWPLLLLRPALPEGRQGAAEPDQATALPINGAAAVAARNRPRTARPSTALLVGADQEQGKADKSALAPICATCGSPIEGRRRGARFCSDSCRVRAAATAFRQRKIANLELGHPVQGRRGWANWPTQSPRPRR